MKRILMLGLLIAAALAVAASSAPADNQVDPEPIDELLYISWSGEGTGAWREFEIYYNPRTGEFEGKWRYDDTHRGWIKGKAVLGTPTSVFGKGEFGGDYAGRWEGMFYFRGICFGKTWARTDPPGDGEFKGI